MCMRFWTHMYGNGIGSLTVSISDTRESQERDIWTLHGEAGNAWYQAEVPVSNVNPFKVPLSMNFVLLFHWKCFHVHRIDDSVLGGHYSQSGEKFSRRCSCG